MTHSAVASPVPPPTLALPEPAVTWLPIRLSACSEAPPAAVPAVAPAPAAAAAAPKEDEAEVEEAPWRSAPVPAMIATRLRPERKAWRSRWLTASRGASLLAWEEGGGEGGRRETTNEGTEGHG